MGFLETSQGRAALGAFLQTKGEGSRKVYKSEVTRFFSFFRGDLQDLSAAHLGAYHRQLTGQSPRSVKRTFSMLKQFFLFLEKQTRGFRSPIGADYGALKAYRTASYLESDPFKRHLESFLEILQAPSTRRSYAAHIRLFFAWSGKDLKELGPADFLAYRDHLGARHLKETSIWLKFVALNRFFKFIATTDRRFKNPLEFSALKLLFPKRDKGYYTALSLEEQKQLLEQPDRRTLIGKRGYAMLRLMLTYGLRAGEVAKLRVGDLEKERADAKRRLWIRDRKGRGRNRVNTAVILEGKALGALEDWLKAAAGRLKLSEDTPLFLGFAYDVISHTLTLRKKRQPLTVRQVENVVNKFVQKAGLTREGEVISSHALRHTAFTTYAKAGRSLLEIKELAGHQDPKTTLIYVHSVQSFEDHIAMHSPIN